MQSMGDRIQSHVIESTPESGGLLVEIRQWYEELFDLPKRATEINFEDILLRLDE